MKFAADTRDIVFLNVRSGDESVCLRRYEGRRALKAYTVDVGTRGSLSLSAGGLQCCEFMRAHVPGFERASYSGIASRVGVRETRRIGGMECLTENDVLSARKRLDGIAKGSHHVDIHQTGTGQIRIPVEGGGSYDIPWGCLLPKGLKNVVAAGRILSADRGAHGSARVMGGFVALATK